MDPITYHVLPILALVVKRAKQMRVPENLGMAAKGNTDGRNSGKHKQEDPEISANSTYKKQKVSRVIL